MTPDPPAPPAPRAAPPSPVRKAVLALLLVALAGVLIWRFASPRSSAADRAAQARADELDREASRIPPPPVVADEPPAAPAEPTRRPVGAK